MSQLKKILVGSRYFFNGYNDFVPKDSDYVEFIEPDKYGEREVHFKDKCVFQIYKKPANEMLNNVINTDLPMKVGKFLVPEFNDYIGLDFSELHKLALLFEKIDEKHTYEKVIFESYMENNSYNLTQEQLDLAYLEYKKARGL